MLDADVGVALGGREARMAEDVLDRPQVGAGVEQLRGEAMAQTVRRDRRSQSRLHDTLGQDILDRARRQPPAPQVSDYRAVELPRLGHRAAPCLERVERR